jgi:hypothetical protein
VEFRNGAVLQGTYVGGTQTTVLFATPTGVQTYLTADIAALHFEAPPIAVPPPPPPAAPPAPVPPNPGQPIVVPAGTILTVRLDMQVSSKSASGTKFTGKLVLDLLAGNFTVAPVETTVFGQAEQSKQAGHLVGKSELKLTLTGLDMGGRLLPIVTTNFEEAGKSSFAKTARNAGVGALVGGAFNGGKGAGRGAAVGVGVSVIRQGDSVTVPVGAILEFRLLQPVTLQP